MEDNFRRYETWRSLVYLSIIAMIDEEYDVVIPHDEFVKMLTVSDIYNYVVNNVE